MKKETNDRRYLEKKKKEWSEGFSSTSSLKGFRVWDGRQAVFMGTGGPRPLARTLGFSASVYSR